MKNIPIIILFAFFFGFSASAQTIFYVNKSSGSDANSGTSWSAAFQNLTKALAAANATSAGEVDIWVAQGVYTPVEGLPVLPVNPRDTSFAIYRGNGVGKGLKVYGGFIGSETSVAARDTGHISYLEGDSDSGSYHVVVIAGLSAMSDSVVLDGFTIRHGIANGNFAKLYNGLSIERRGGGGIIMAGNASPLLSVNNCRITRNVTANNGYDCATGQRYSARGAGIFDSSSTVNFSNCTIDSNYINGIFPYPSAAVGEDCPFWLGGIYGGDALGGGMYVDTSSITMNNCRIEQNQVTSDDGSGYSSVVSVINGVGLYIKRSNISANHTVFRSNNCDLFLYSEPDSLDNGGGMYADHINGSFSNCIFLGNAVLNNGGGIYCSFSSPIFNGCTINYNVGGDYSLGVSCRGGGIYNNYSNPVFNNCIIDSNLITTDDSAFGGGIYSTFSSPQFNNCHIDYNQSNNFLSYDEFGGGVASELFSNPVFNNCTINNNYSSTGAGIYSASSSTLSLLNCVIANNAIRGLTLKMGGGIYIENGTLAIMKCAITGNNSSFGGGICSISSNTVIDSSNISGNMGLDCGGGIFQKNNTLHVANSIFSSDTCQNHIYKGGGAIHVEGDGAYFTSANNIYSRNMGFIGGAVSVVYDSLSSTDTMVNNVFVGNSIFDYYSVAGGGALNLGGGKHYVVNNTFANDTSITTGGAVVFTDTGGSYTFANNIFYGNIDLSGVNDTVDLTTSGIFSFANNTFGMTDPLFVNAIDPIGADGMWRTADDGLRLQECSVAIDAGDNVYVLPGETDVTADLRIAGSTVDIGAYENALAGHISGAVSGDTLCAGSNLLLIDPVPGGVWTSSNIAFATITSTGDVTALSSGIDTIYYTYTGSCINQSTYVVATIAAPPLAAAITGADTVCQFGTITLTASAIGGVWTLLDPSLASIVPAGISSSLSGSLPGVDTIFYTLTNACGSTRTSFPITIFSDAHCVSLVADLANADAVGLKIFPNPATDEITMEIKTDRDEFASVTLTNVVGEKVKKWNFKTNSTFSSRLNLPAGLYIVSVLYGDKRYSAKLVVE